MLNILSYCVICPPLTCTNFQSSTFALGGEKFSKQLQNWNFRSLQLSTQMSSFGVQTLLVNTCRFVDKPHFSAQSSNLPQDVCQQTNPHVVDGLQFPLKKFVDKPPRGVVFKLVPKSLSSNRYMLPVFKFPPKCLLANRHVVLVFKFSQKCLSKNRHVVSVFTNFPQNVCRQTAMWCCFQTCTEKFVVKPRYVAGLQISPKIFVDKLPCLPCRSSQISPKMFVDKPPCGSIF